jgi:multidrug efflux pump subunit AcrA (membrane-fusion protein)
MAVEMARLRLVEAEAEHDRRLAEAELAVQSARLKLDQAEIDYPRQLALAGLNLQTAESALRQAHLRYPSTTVAEIRLQNATEAESKAEVEYQEALERQKANWEPAEVAESYRSIFESAEDARVIAEAEFNTTQGAQAANAEALTCLEAEIERAKIALERLEAGVDPLLALDLEKVRQSLTGLMEAGVDPTLALELEEAQTNLADLREAEVDPLLVLAVQKAQADLEAANVIARINGVVLEVPAKPGETVVSGAELITLAIPDAVEARVTVIEEDLPLVQVGQPVELFFDARPEATVNGEVTRIAPQRVMGEGRPLYHVFITAARLPQGLLAGMTVDAAIIIEQRTDVLQLPRALVRAGSIEMAQVEVWVNGRAERRLVRLGLRGDVHVEIVSGLREGERVVGQ